MDGMQPGQVVVPQGPDEPQQPSQPPVQPNPGAPVPVRPQEDPEPTPVPTPVPAPDPTVVAQPAAVGTPPPVQERALPERDEQANWQYTQVADSAPASVDQPLPDSITWTASEFITHEKGLSWYAVVVVGGVLAAVADYLLLKDVFSSVIILFAAVAFVAISARKPRTQQYALTPMSLQIGNKPYYFQDFKNFSVTEDGAIASIIFMPMKRFMPSLTIYVAPDMEDQVIGFLSAILPFEQHSADAVDSLMRRIRF